MSNPTVARFLAILAGMAACRALYALGRRWLRKN